MATKHTIYQAKYDSTHRRTYGFRLHNELDKDIIDKLASVPSMQGYIKQLIREDISRTCFAPKKESEEKKMKTYTIKPEYLDMWEGGDTPSNPDRVITEDDIRTFSKEWDVPVSELLDQLNEID